MAELTPKERVLRLLRKEPIDTMPFFSGMGMVVMPGIKKAGYNFPSIHTDAERMAMSAVWSAKLMGFDCVVVPFDMTMESEAIGNKISLYEESEDILYPTIPEKKWKSMDDVGFPDNITELGTVKTTYVELRGLCSSCLELNNRQDNDAAQRQGGTR